MSAAPVYPARRPVRPSTKALARPTRRRPRVKSWAQVFVANVTLFALATTLTFGLSTLLGHSMKETARHEAVRDGARARAAHLDTARIKSRIERLSTIRSVDDWSQLNGFVTSFQLAHQAKPTVQAIVKAPVTPDSANMKVEVVVARVDDGTAAH